MGSNYIGEGNRRLSSSSSSSSRKGKKPGSDKPKTPQRGLGVAQLEKIRLHSELGRSFPPSVHSPYAQSFGQEDLRLRSSSTSSPLSPYVFPGAHGIGMGFQDLDRANIRYGEFQQGNVSRWSPGNAGAEHFHSVHPNMTTRSFFDPDFERPCYMNYRDDSFSASNRHSESNGSQDIDLELRL